MALNNRRKTLIKVNIKSHKSSSLEKYEIIHPFLEGKTTLPKLSIYHDVSLRSLRRWVKIYREKGLKGLERKTRSTQGQRTSVSKELEQIIEALVLQKPPLTYAAIHRKIEKIAKHKQQTAPSYIVVRDIAKKINKSLLVLSQEGSKAYNQAFELIYRRESIRPNEMWQADHSPIDIVLIDDKGKGRKPWLTIIIDDYSRAICGFYLSFDAPCSLHVSLALRQSIWRKANSKWQVCGIPSVLYTDNGSDFISNHIKQLAVDLKIQLKNSIPGKPQGRGRVERFFLTVTQLLLMNLPGYTPPKTTFATPKLTLETFALLFEKFLVEEYHHKEHRATKEKPLERWQNNGFLPQLPESLEELDLLLISVTRPRKVHRDGIYFQNFTYIDTNLAAYVGESVTIRYDPRDLGEIRVFFQGKFLCKAICPELSNKVVSLKEIIRARQKRKRNLRKTLTDRKTLLDSILEDIPDRVPTTRKKQKQETPDRKHKLKLYRNED